MALIMISTGPLHEFELMTMTAQELVDIKRCGLILFLFLCLAGIDSLVSLLLT